MPFIQLPSMRFYYELRGRGDRLLIFNGSGGDLRRKPNLLDGPLSGHFETLCHDQRGLGQTDQPDTAYSMADYADDAASLLDALHWSDCHVMGVSFGGMVAQEFAIRHPDRVNRLVLACTSSGGVGGASFPLHTLDDLTPEDRALKTIGLIDTRMNSEWARKNPEAVKNILSALAPARKSESGEEDRNIGSNRQMEARKEHDTWQRLQGITKPVLCCGGLHDGIAPPENMRRLAERIPGALLEFFDGGHTFLHQDPRAWTSIIDFLEAPFDPDHA